ncbi:MAG: phosphoglycolate phosphatase [Ottowia sp.]|nr:phosphoglycolate phosphatase [Ottowia sp.]
MSSPALPHFTACLFDLDGTLVDTLGDFEAALGAMLETHGRARVSRAQIARMVGRGTPALIAAALALEPDAPPLDAEAAQALYLQHYFRINGQHARVYAGAAEALAALHAQGVPLACVTNKPQAAACALLAQKGLAPFFAHIFGGESFARRKPDPLPLIEACRALGSAPAHTLMVGDSAFDAQAAAAAGCPFALVAGGYAGDAPAGAIAADWHLDNLAQLVGIFDGIKAPA